MTCYVPFHKELTQDDKDDIPRAYRFIFLEISLKAREAGHGGWVRIKRRLSDAEAIRDLIGGDLDEIKGALNDKPQDGELTLVSEGMIRIERSGDEARVVLPSWDKWAGPKTSAERMREARERARTGRDDASVTGDEGSVTGCDDGDAYRIGKDTKSKEEKGAATGLDMGSEILSPKVASLLEGLSVASDLFGDVDLVALAKRIEQKLSFEPKADKLDRRLVGSECATAVREAAAKFPRAPDASRAATAERKADWLLRDVRAGKIDPAPRPAGERANGIRPATATDQELLDDARASAARADAEQARKAAAADKRPPADPKGLASALGAQLGKIKRPQL